MARDVSLLPKAHLHLHFTGSMRPRTLLELADKYGVHLPDALTGGAAPPPPAADERGRRGLRPPKGGAGGPRPRLRRGLRHRGGGGAARRPAGGRVVGPRQRP